MAARILNIEDYLLINASRHPTDVLIILVGAKYGKEAFASRRA